MGKVDEAGRAIAGLLGYNPGPGIYSRLERAVQGMPANVRVQELPGLLKRYKEGVPGWELKATDLDSTIAGRDVVPRDELLSAVRERSPVYTHREMLKKTTDGEYATDASAIGRAERPYSAPDYESYGQGGKDYSELLLLQPHATADGFDSPHFSGRLAQNAVAHARFDTHGDALRINELQSDLGIHNRKIREIENGPNVTARYGDQVYATDDMGIERPIDPQLPFPLEDAWAELLIKRLALEAARKGHRAIEVASPRAIADKVGGNIENYEHFYGKVVPGAIERLGRKMGGMIDESPPPFVSPANAHEEIRKLLQQADKEMQQVGWRARGYDPNPVPGKEGELWLDGPSIGRTGWRNFAAMQYAASPEIYDRSMDALGGRVFTPDVWGGYGPPNMQAVGEKMYDDLMRHEGFSPQSAGQVVGEALRLADQSSQLRARYLRSAASARPAEVPPISRRYTMSDAMRRNLIEKGVGASVLAPLLMQGDGE